MVLFPAGGQASVEGDLKGVEGFLPAVGPAFAALYGGVEAHDGKVDAFECGLLVGEVAAGVDRSADAGVDRFDGYLESLGVCRPCWTRRCESRESAWWIWLSAAVHQADLPEERCLFSGSSRPPRRLSRGPFWVMTIPRSGRSSGIWLT